MDRILDFCFASTQRAVSTGLVASLLVIAVLSAPSFFYAHFTGGTLTSVVENKERVCDGGQDGKCRWMVMTQDLSMVNSDSIWHLKFDSTDVQGRVRIGEEQTFTYYGWRIPFFSVYPNIVSVE